MHSVTPAGALVGRDGEMALLIGLIKDVARGRGTSVLIEGEPGIGKSALVRAAVSDAPEAGCQVFWGAGDELGQELPLLPFLDALRVREPSANPRREAIVRLLRGEAARGPWYGCAGGARGAVAGARRRAVRGPADHPDHR